MVLSDKIQLHNDLFDCMKSLRDILQKEKMWDSKKWNFKFECAAALYSLNSSDFKSLYRTTKLINTSELIFILFVLIISS